MKKSPIEADDGERHELQHGRDDLDACRSRARPGRSMSVSSQIRPMPTPRGEQVVVAERGPEDGERSRRRRRRSPRCRPRRRSSSPRRSGSRRSRRTRGARRRTGRRCAGSARPRLAKTSASRIAPAPVKTQASMRDGTGGAGQRCGQQEHARADHVADDERRGHPEAHRALQLRGCRGDRGGGGGHVLLLGRSTAGVVSGDAPILRRPGRAVIRRKSRSCRGGLRCMDRLHADGARACPA